MTVRDRRAAAVNPSAHPPEPLDGWPAFAAAVLARLQKGREAYRDESFERPAGDLLDEIQQELLDVCGWAFITHARVQRMRAAVQGTTAQRERT